MNVGMILDENFPPDPRVENEALELIKNGYKVYLFCFDYTFKKKKNEIVNGIFVERVFLKKIFKKLSALAYTTPLYHLLLKRAIRNFIKDNKIDVIHIHNIQIARAVFNVNKFFGKKIVLDLHENRPEIMKFYAHNNTIFGKILVFPAVWRKFEQKYILKADRVIVVTPEARDYYVNFYKTQQEKFCLVPNTPNKSFFETYEENAEIRNQLNGKYSVLYVGDTGRRRGIFEIIEAIPLLIEEIPNLLIVIVGHSVDNRLYKKRVKLLGVEKHVCLTGWKDFKLFPSFIINSKIGLCPFHRNIHHDTTYSNKMFQYLAFGKPVIVSDCLSQRLFVDKNLCGLVFEAKNKYSLAEKILLYYNDIELYNKHSQNGYNAVRNDFFFEKTSNELINMYKDFHDK
jgi:glycosyltransferase involved in cell wall biosynthesis